MHYTKTGIFEEQSGWKEERENHLREKFAKLLIQNANYAHALDFVIILWLNLKSRHDWLDINCGLQLVNVCCAQRTNYVSVKFDNSSLRQVNFAGILT